MTHITIQEQLDGETADWMEKVTGEQSKPDSPPKEPMRG